MKLKKIIKEHSLGELPSSKLIKMKWNPLTDKSPIKEDNINEGGFSNIKRPRDISRMEGLHNLKHMKEMLKYASLLYQDMEEEGFEGAEIYDFLHYKIQKTNL
jgi:hypothetical protein